jgi:ankyrin repeat protein
MSSHGNRNRLFSAIERGNVQDVRNLLNHVNVNTRDGYNRTPLARAIQMRHVNIVRLLLQKGARAHRVNLRNLVWQMHQNWYHNGIQSENNRVIKNLLVNAIGRQTRQRLAFNKAVQAHRRRKEALKSRALARVFGNHLPRNMTNEIGSLTKLRMRR